MSNNTKKEWFETWFNSKFYHILYQHRNDHEAEAFIAALVHFLNIPKGKHVVDLACGKGRHSLELYKLGLEVTGLDLAENSIAHAKSFENENLRFAVHDMRDLYQENYAEYVFNLFTSFGYFDNENDNIQTLKNVHKLLKKDGILVIDYLNPDSIISSFPIHEEKTVKGIDFKIKKHCDGQFIYKDIAFEAEGKQHQHQEKVQQISSELFCEWLTKSGFEIIERFGDYKLSPYIAEQSPRQIIISKRK